jgi:hypothetical protein
MHGYWIIVTDGKKRMRTVFEGADAIFAVMSARAFFQGTKWRVLSEIS